MSEVKVREYLGIGKNVSSSSPSHKISGTRLRVPVEVRVHCRNGV